jgi:L-rhamnose isomerase
MDEFTELRHTYLTRFLELQQHLQQLEKREAAAKRAQASKFPQSVVELNDSPKDVQQRVAKFLLSDKEGQEKMLDEFGWAWRQTDALMNEYKTNVSPIVAPRTTE